MPSILRCEKMVMCDVYIQPEAAFEILAKLGEMGCVQFLDTKEDLQIFQRSYVAEVRRFDEMDRKLRFLEAEIRKEDIKISKGERPPPALHPNETLAFENFLDQWHDDIEEMAKNEASLMKTYSELQEMQYILRGIGPFLGDAEGSPIGKGLLAVSHLLRRGHLYVTTGVVRRSKSFVFETMLWRISRGNIYYKVVNEDKIIYDTQTGQDNRMVAFLAVCQGEEINERVQKVCSGFRAHVYSVPTSYAERESLEINVSNKLEDLEQVLKKTKFHRCKALRLAGRQWYYWTVQIKKSAAIYHNLNRFNFDVTKNCLIGRCWVAESDLNRVQSCLENTSKEVETNVPSFMTTVTTEETPPILYRTNKFTAGFQHLIDAYGAPIYRELNPGIYTIITFPFLFAVMFGDMGHGVILIVFASWMIKEEYKYMDQHSTNEIWNIMFAGRYIILLLGLFSTYTGFIYNDIFSRSLNLPTSCLTQFVTANLSHGGTWLQAVPNGDGDDDDYESDYDEHGLPKKPLDKRICGGYIFGLDPLLPLTNNKVMIENSIKMKMSIILGVIHMQFGVILSFFNHVYFKKYYLIFLQFIPELLLLTCLFFWLVVLIYLKWFMYWEGHARNHSSCAPQLLILFIEMFLMKETKPIGKGCEAYLFPGQKTLQTCFLLIALVCIVVMLFGTPVYLMRYHKKQRDILTGKGTNFRRYQQRSSLLEEGKPNAALLKKHTISFGDLLIHQAIHTVEYVLSTVSHTASYLRLWALSLAHAGTALSEMLWHMVLSKLALTDHSVTGSIKLVIIFAVWAFFTISILVVMEGLSAFLHTLRLHWVEFMTKFFEGGGIMFQPFCFQEILSEQVKHVTPGLTRGKYHHAHLH